MSFIFTVADVFTDFGVKGGGDERYIYLVLREITGSNATVQEYHIAHGLEASSLTSSIWDKSRALEMYL